MNRAVVLAVAVATAAGLSPAVAGAAPTVRYINYKNCAAMNKVYPHGVGRSGAHDHTTSTPVTNFYRNTRLYTINKSHDRDKDGIACEKR